MTVHWIGRPAVRDPIADAIDGLKWRSIGPANNAGRISVVVGVPGDPSTYYVAGAAGGIIKTTNGGVTFRHIFDKQDVASVGAIAIARFNADTCRARIAVAACAGVQRSHFGTTGYQAIHHFG